MGDRPPVKTANIAPGVFAAISGELDRSSARAQVRRKDLLVSWLFETSQRVQTSFDHHLRPFGMTLQEASVLFRCVESGKMTHGELTLTIGRDISKVTRFIERLEVKHLVTRGSDRHDRRLSIIKATRNGKMLAARLTRVFGSVRKALFAGIQDSDVRETEKMLRQLYKNAVRVRSQKQKGPLRRRRIVNQTAKPRGQESNQVGAASDGTKSMQQGVPRENNGLRTGI